MSVPTPRRLITDQNYEEHSSEALAASIMELEAWLSQYGHLVDDSDWPACLANRKKALASRARRS